MKKRVLCLSAIITILCSSQVYATEFSDIDNLDIKNQIEYFENQGFLEVFSNKETTKFNPEAPVTRGEFSILLHEVFDVALLQSNENLPFVDITNMAEEFMPYVQSSYYNEIIAGKLIDGKLYYGFNEIMNREEMITIVGRYFGLTSEEENLFKDESEVKPWAVQHVSYFYNNNIFKLDEKGNFNPQQYTTREEVVEVLYEIEKLITSQKDNGLVVENYIGNGSIGYKVGSFSDSAFTMITDIDIYGQDSILIADSLANQIKIANEEEDTVSVLFGKHKDYDFSGLPIGGYVDGSVEDAILNKPNKVLVYDNNTIIFTEEETNTIRGYDVENKEIFTLAGKEESGYINGTNNIALFNKPTGLAKDSMGNVYVADTLNNVIRIIDKNYNVELYAGNPEEYGNKVGSLEVAQFNEPTDLFIINDILYVCDSGNNMVKKIENGKVTIVAGLAL